MSFVNIFSLCSCLLFSFWFLLKNFARLLFSGQLWLPFDLISKDVLMRIILTKHVAVTHQGSLSEEKEA